MKRRSLLQLPVALLAAPPFPWRLVSYLPRGYAYVTHEPAFVGIMGKATHIDWNDHRHHLKSK